MAVQKYNHKGTEGQGKSENERPDSDPASAIQPRRRRDDIEAIGLMGMFVGLDGNCGCAFGH